MRSRFLIQLMKQVNTKYKRGITMPITPQGKQFVYDLTMEYIKQNNMLKCDSTSEIHERIEEISKASKEIDKAITTRYHDFDFL